MTKTSFGRMDPLLKVSGKVVAEYLVFESEGRQHKHNMFESFAVLTGVGRVVCGHKTFEVAPGDIVTIPPHTPHWMIPKEGQEITGLLWYHDELGSHQHGA